jgi:hypothetical protein
MANWEQYIVEAARKRGIDPNIALQVARSEGGVEGHVQSRVKRNGVQEPSYGPFQLLKGGQNGFPMGMGNDMLMRTGLDPADPNNTQATIDFALDQAKVGGWGPWMGAKKLGITGMEGIDGRGVTLNSNRTGVAPMLPDPIEVKSHPVAGVPEEAGIFDKIASGVDKIGPAIFGGQENADKLKSMFGAGADPKSPMMAGLGMVKDAMKRKDPEREQFIPSSGALSPSADASRMASAQQLMATILAARKQNRGRGLTLGGMA